MAIPSFQLIEFLQSTNKIWVSGFTKTTSHYHPSWICCKHTTLNLQGRLHRLHGLLDIFRSDHANFYLTFHWYPYHPARVNEVKSKESIIFCLLSKFVAKIQVNYTFRYHIWFFWLDNDHIGISACRLFCITFSHITFLHNYQ